MEGERLLKIRFIKKENKRTWNLYPKSHIDSNPSRDRSHQEKILTNHLFGSNYFELFVQLSK